MIIEYQLSRTDLFKTYYRSILHSARARRSVFSTAAILAGIILIERLIITKTLGAFDVVFSIGIGAIFVLIVPFYGLIFTRPQKRILSIGSEGIETRNNAQVNNIPWAAVASIAASGEEVVITGKNSNALSIPARAFASQEEKEAFIRQARVFHENAAG